MVWGLRASCLQYAFLVFIPMVSLSLSFSISLALSLSLSLSVCLSVCLSVSLSLSLFVFVFVSVSVSVCLSVSLSLCLSVSLSLSLYLCLSLVSFTSPKFFCSFFLSCLFLPFVSLTLNILTHSPTPTTHPHPCSFLHACSAPTENFLTF